MLRVRAVPERLATSAIQLGVMFFLVNTDEILRSLVRCGYPLCPVKGRRRSPPSRSPTYSALACYVIRRIKSEPDQTYLPVDALSGGIPLAGLGFLGGYCLDPLSSDGGCAKNTLSLGGGR